MGARTGSAKLPLHGGRIPPWLATRMATLGRLLTEAIVVSYGPTEFLRRLSHPFWFQALGAVMGMDWHSSGITTSVLGALKRGLRPVEDELGLYVCGGRGRHSRRTPSELLVLGERLGLDGDALARTSRLVAKVDSAAVQDGYALYLHGFVLGRGGEWTVIQQGMNPQERMARRYHWLSEGLTSFVDNPHQAVEGTSGGVIVNLADVRAQRSRQLQLDLIRRGPDVAVEQILQANILEPSVTPSSGLAQQALPFLNLPSHHEVRAENVVRRRLQGALAAAAERGPVDFPDLLLTPGVGPRTLWALAMTSEVVHGAPCRFTDPARFSLAHGGKDGHPFPVPLKVYDQTLCVWRDALRRAKLGQDDRLSALRRLDEASRRLERVAKGPSFEELLEQERRDSASYEGHTVSGPAAPLQTPAQRAHSGG